MLGVCSRLSCSFACLRVRQHILLDFSTSVRWAAVSFSWNLCSSCILRNVSETQVSSIVHLGDILESKAAFRSEFPDLSEFDMCIAKHLNDFESMVNVTDKLRRVLEFCKFGSIWKSGLVFWKFLDKLKIRGILPDLWVSHGFSSWITEAGCSPFFARFRSDLRWASPTWFLRYYF